jgi:hypothetical protein
MIMKNRMTPAQFAAAAALARLSLDRCAVARAVLVDGKTYSDAVAPYGWTRQAACAPVKSIQDNWSRYQAACAAEASCNGAAKPDADNAESAEQTHP